MSRSTLGAVRSGSLGKFVRQVAGSLFNRLVELVWCHFSELEEMALLHNLEKSPPYSLYQSRICTGIPHVKMQISLNPKPNA